MSRSTFCVLFYTNGSKEKNGIVPKELWDAKGNKAKGKKLCCHLYQVVL